MSVKSGNGALLAAAAAFEPEDAAKTARAGAS
jgi:hypothetical protein